MKAYITGNIRAFNGKSSRSYSALERGWIDLIESTFEQRTSKAVARTRGIRRKIAGKQWKKTLFTAAELLVCFSRTFPLPSLSAAHRFAPRDLSPFGLPSGGLKRNPFLPFLPLTPGHFAKKEKKERALSLFRLKGTAPSR